MKTDKTDILFKQMYKEIDRIELEYRERIAQIVNDKNINDDDKKRLIFYLVNKYTENIPVLQIEKESKNIFSFLKRKENNE